MNGPAWSIFCQYHNQNLRNAEKISQGFPQEKKHFSCEAEINFFNTKNEEVMNFDTRLSTLKLSRYGGLLNWRRKINTNQRRWREFLQQKHKLLASTMIYDVSVSLIIFLCRSSNIYLWHTFLYISLSYYNNLAVYEKKNIINVIYSETEYFSSGED
jgi:hypothetical protein